MPGDVKFLEATAAATPAGAVPPELQAAWTQYMVGGFKQNEQMFQRTLEAFMKPYRLSVWLYAILFAVGIGLFVVAAVVGLGKGDSVVAIAFAGLSVGDVSRVLLASAPSRARREPGVHHLARGCVQYLLDSAHVHVGSEVGSGGTQGRRGRFPRVGRKADHLPRRTARKTPRRRLTTFGGFGDVKQQDQVDSADVHRGSQQP